MGRAVGTRRRWRRLAMAGLAAVFLGTPAYLHVHQVLCSSAIVTGDSFMDYTVPANAAGWAADVMVVRVTRVLGDDCSHSVPQVEYQATVVETLTAGELPEEIVLAVTGTLRSLEGSTNDREPHMVAGGTYVVATRSPEDGAWHTVASADPVISGRLRGAQRTTWLHAIANPTPGIP